MNNGILCVVQPDRCVGQDNQRHTEGARLWLTPEDVERLTASGDVIQATFIGTDPADLQAAAAEAQRLADQQAAAAEAQRLADQQAAAAEAQRLADEQAAAAEAQRLADEQAAAAGADGKTTTTKGAKAPKA